MGHGVTISNLEGRSAEFALVGFLSAPACDEAQRRSGLARNAETVWNFHRACGRLDANLNFVHLVLDPELIAGIR